ncbi:MAG: hypothetical protein ABI361_02490 [Nitrososphaera sp.]
MKLIQADGDGALAEEFEIREPALILGIGHVGGKIASGVARSCGCEHLEMVYEADHLSEIENCVHIARRGWANPSAPKLRSLASAHLSEIATKLREVKTVFMVANLAGRGGVGIGPLVCRVAKEKGCKVVSIVIMPFGFEHDKIFASGVALRRIQDASDSLIIVDNNAYLQNNPQHSLEQCYAAINQAVHDSAVHVLRGGRSSGGIGIVTTGTTPNNNLGSSLEASLAALYPQLSEHGSVGRAVIHVTHAGNSKLSLDNLSVLVGRVRAALSDSSSASVSMTTAGSLGESQVHLVTSVLNGTVFDSYDPLAQVIPKEKFIDWEELDASPDLSLPVFGIE